MSDSLDNAMRVMADQARQIDRLRAELHNLKWALGTEGYEQMATPEEQAEHDKAVHAHNEFLARLEKGKTVYEELKADAEQARSVLRHLEWSASYSYCTGWPSCPVCHGIKPGYGADEDGNLPLNQGHRDGCSLAVAIDDMMSSKTPVKIARGGPAERD